MTEGPYELPAGWVWTTLGDVSDTTRKKRHPQDYPNMPFIGLEHVESETMRLLGTTTAAEMSSAAEYFEPGDVLYGRLRPYLNKVFRPDFEGLCSAEFIIFRRVEGVDSRYLQYFLNSSPFVSFATHINAGDRPRVNFDQLADYPFPLASEPEQRRIVAKIEELLTSLEAGVAGLNRIQAALKRYRAAVLKAACEGRLLPQDPNDEPAEKLLERILAERRANYNEPKSPNAEWLPVLPVGWSWASLDSLLSEPLSNGKSVPSVKSGFPILRLTALRDGGIDLTQTKLGALSPEQAERFLVHRGDFLVSRGNGSIKLVGRGGLITTEPGRVAYPDLLIRVRVIQELCAPQFLSAIWSSSLIRQQIETVARTTAGIFKINQQDMERFVTPLPPLATQYRIVAEVERRLSVVSQSEKMIEANLVRAERLRQAILRRAFEGKLVADDQPADLRLERSRTVQ